MGAVTSTYQGSIVCLSIIIAIVASFAELDIGIHITKAKGMARYIWLYTGAVFGLGI
ncbi:hypothetical protein [Peribacillus deserti]|uniref:hypothetical protein n=1 Tax=Peribacillus deserti TaxID=673318 RepID=UPI0015E12A39|nr:hypothetical protein [Peribacillus deserti]